MNREPKTSMDSLWWFPCKKNRWSLHIPTLWRFASGRPSRVPARYKVLTRFPQDRCEGHARWTRYARLPAMQGRQPMVRNNNAGHRAAKRPKTLINHTSARRARSAPQLPRTSAAASSACGSARRLLLASLARRVHAPILARLFLGVVALILLCASIPQPANATVSVPPSFANNVTVKKRDAATGALKSPITWWDLSDGTWCVCGSVHSNAPSIGDTYGAAVAVEGFTYSDTHDTGNPPLSSAMVTSSFDAHAMAYAAAYSPTSASAGQPTGSPAEKTSSVLHGNSPSIW